MNKVLISKNKKLFKEKMLQKVSEELTKVNKQLKKYNKVNRIYSFIENIDNKNNEAISETFENVKKSFSKFFKYLTGIWNYFKIKELIISVSFNEEQKNSQSMYQLSGGTKSCCLGCTYFCFKHY